ncbi:hypoxanthine phosphoribosyltransferase [Candidatus Woesearchaeota archaeon]|nr:hypoxanthine phosphoribosyltransferase [Candidatus Woesearchaeota archaeon]
MNPDIKNIIENDAHIQKVMFTYDQINHKTIELACDIARSFPIDKPIVAICVLKGAVPFYSLLCQKLSEKGFQVDFEFVRIRSYIGTDSSGTVEIRLDREMDIDDKNVLIVEDIVDTGATLEKLKRFLNEKHSPNDIKICTLLDKPSRRLKDTKIDFIGFEIPDEFVIGFGMDCDQKYRALPFIAIYKQ